MDYVLFQAAELIKEGLIREWSSLNHDEIKGLRAYLLSYVINHPTLSGYIRERIVQVVAIAIKRQSVDDLGEDRRQVLNEVSQLITGKESTVWKFKNFATVIQILREIKIKRI